MADLAAPKYQIDQTVDYKDHHNRVITGKIQCIEAHWSKSGRDPLIVYTISHPTYKNRRCYRAEEGIMR